MKLFRLSPLTEKRLQRFYRSKVALWSLRLLILLYLVSLCAELICNGKPLMLRFKGETTFPFLRSQPAEAVQDAALGDTPRVPGLPVHVDYRTFTESDAFLDDPHAFVLWAPVRYSPGETLDTADLEKDKVVTVSLVPNQPIGRFNLTKDGKIIRQDSCAQFFPHISLRDEQTALNDLIILPETLRNEIARRFRGEARPAFETEIEPLPQRAFPWARLHLHLAPSDGLTPVETVRINLRAILSDGRTFLPKLTYDYVRSVDDKGRPGAPMLRLRNGQTAPDAKLRKQLDFWGAHGFKKDITAADQFAYIAPDRTVYAVTSGSNIRFPFRPTARHICGLDGSGRDVFSRILYATRIAVSFGLLLAVAATLIGLFVGSLQGYFGGKVDIVVQRITEIWAALPFLYIMVLVGAVFGRSFWLLLLVYGLFCWLGLSYYMRAEFLRLRNRPFVAAARCQGLGHARIIFRHILPNALTPIITLFPFLLVGAISSLVSLDFLGFGLPPLTPSWGELLNQAQTYRWAWWLILFPSLAIFLVMFLTVLVGEGVRNAFDPKPFSKLQ